MTEAQEGFLIDRRLQQGMEKVQLLTKLNPNKDLLSPSRWGSSIWEHALCAVCMDRDDHIILAGFGPGRNPRESKIYLAKMHNGSQKIIWAKQFTAKSDDEICQVLAMPNNQILLVGSIHSTSRQRAQFCLMKFSQQGRLIYRRAYPLTQGCVANDAILSVDGRKVMITGTDYHPGRHNTAASIRISTMTGEVERKPIIKTQLAASEVVMANPSAALAIREVNSPAFTGLPLTMVINEHRALKLQSRPSQAVVTTDASADNILAQAMAVVMLLVNGMVDMIKENVRAFSLLFSEAGMTTELAAEMAGQIESSYQSAHKLLGTVPDTDAMRQEEKVEFERKQRQRRQQHQDAQRRLFASAKQSAQSSQQKATDTAPVASSNRMTLGG